MMTSGFDALGSNGSKKVLTLLVALSVLAMGVGGATAQSADAGYTISKHAGWDTHEGELWGAAIGCVGGGAAVGASSLGAGAGVGCAAGGSVGAA